MKKSGWLRLFAVSAFALALMGCATQSNPPLSSLVALGAPATGTARIVVVRPEKGFFALGDRAFPILLDGEPLGELVTGDYAFLDRPGGRHQLSAEFWDSPGVTRIDFTAVPGRTHYFVASLNEKANDLRVVSAISPIGGLLASAATYTDRQGPISLAPLSEVEAKKVMAARQDAGR